MCDDRVLRQSERNVGAGRFFFDDNVRLKRLGQLGQLGLEQLGQLRRSERDECERKWRRRHDRLDDNLR